MAKKVRSRRSVPRAPRQQLPLPFMAEYLEVVVRPKLASLIRDVRFSSVADLVAAFNDRHPDDRVTEGRMRDFMRKLGLAFERTTVLVRAPEPTAPTAHNPAATPQSDD